MPVTLGQVIRERRMELDLTQEELAERVGEGVRQSDISRLERNRVGLPRRHRMEELAVALDIPLGVLLARSGWAGAEALDESTVDFDSASEPAAEPAGEVSSAVVDSSRERSAVDDAEPSAAEWDDEAGESRNLYSVFGDHDQWDADSLSAEDSQSIRDTVTRTEALIRQTRERIDDTHSKLAESRRSAERRQATGSS